MEISASDDLPSNDETISYPSEQRGQLEYPLSPISGPEVYTAPVVKELPIEQKVEITDFVSPTPEDESTVNVQEGTTVVNTEENRDWGMLRINSFKKKFRKILSDSMKGMKRMSLIQMK